MIDLCTLYMQFGLQISASESSCFYSASNFRVTNCVYRCTGVSIYHRKFERKVKKNIWARISGHDIKEEEEDTFI